jgi:AbrB family looped-hinge helix DNA binding protein
LTRSTDPKAATIEVWIIARYVLLLFSFQLFFIDGLFKRNHIKCVSTTLKTDAVWFTAKGQIVIPARLRKQFHIEDGTKAVVEATPDGILLKPVTSWAIERGYGLLKRKSGSKPFSDEWLEHKREERELEDK